MLGQYQLIRLTDDFDISDFNCGNNDLNDFLINDARSYANELLATTYLFVDPEKKNKIVAFFSLANDRISYESDSRSIWNRLCRIIPNHKRKRNFPAVLLARLGVTTEIQSGGVGGEIINFIKGWFTIRNKTGCRFLLVDAYNKDNVLRFYQNNEFEYLRDDQNDKTRSMFYDLLRSIPRD